VLSSIAVENGRSHPSLYAEANLKTPLLDRFHDCAGTVSQARLSLDNVRGHQSDEDQRVDRGSHSPADLASRGVPLQVLVDKPLWWQ